jgi:hypothetical protein
MISTRDIVTVLGLFVGLRVRNLGLWDGLPLGLSDGAKA